MKLRLTWKITLFALLIGCGVLVLNAGEGTRKKGDSCFEWMCMRHADLYLYLIRHSDVKADEKALFEKKAYEFYFTYWVLTRSEHASCPPAERFEEYFTRLVRNEVIAHVDRTDPLSIKPLYENGVCKDPKQLPTVEGLKDNDLLSWANYQALVEKYTNTFNFR